MNDSQCCKSKSWLGLVIVGLIIVGLVSYFLQGEKAEKKPNVVVLLLDTLRSDHLGMNGYERDTSPNLDAFAEKHLKFSYTVSTSPWTPPSVATIFTGLYPSAHGMMPPSSRDTAIKKSTMLDGELRTLAEVFKDNGYQTGAVTPNPWMRKEFGYQQGFDQYRYFHRVRAEKINAEGLKLLDEFKEDKPFFLYLHYLDPHNPYNPPKEFNIYKGNLKARTYPEKQQRFINLYDGEIRYLDDQLGKLFEQFKARGIYEDLIILIVADHGEQFMEHGHQGHGHNTYNEEIHVPLMLKAGSRKGDVRHTTSLVDVFPTLLDLVKIAKPDNIHGVSLLDHEAAINRPGVLAEIGRRQNEKAFVNPVGDKIVMKYDPKAPWILEPEQEPFDVALYNHEKDYQEKAPLSDPPVLHGLVADFRSFYEDLLKKKPSINGKEIEMQQGTIEELESLGYL